MTKLDKMAGMRNDPKRREMMAKIASAPDLPCEVGGDAKMQDFIKGGGYVGNLKNRIMAESRKRDKAPRAPFKLTDSQQEALDIIVSTGDWFALKEHIEFLVNQYADELNAASPQQQTER